MFKEVAKTHPLALGLASAPCRKEHCLKCSGTGCLDKPIAVYRDPHMRRLSGLRVETNGISRRVYASGKSCFCRDIRDFSIWEYPLAHHARVSGLSFSFATCIQSFQEESGNVLVLEFLLLTGRYDIGNIRLFTRSLLTKIKELLPHYMVAVEDFPGEELFPKNYDPLKYDEIDHVQVGHIPLSLPATCRCDDGICYLDNGEEVVDFFLPINLSYEESSEVVVFWKNDVETCNGVDEGIKLVFKHVPMGHNGVEVLQFWAPRRIAGRSFLTTYGHPFAITPQGISKVTCLYMIECMTLHIYVDEEGNSEGQLGPVWHAFKNGVVECSPEVRFYTIKEFPLRDHAVLWDIEGIMFLPVFELHGNGTVGVLEILYKQHFELVTYLNNLAMELKKMRLRIDYVHPRPGQSNSQKEIEKLCEAVSVRYPLQFARMLTPSLPDYCHNNSSQEYISRIWSRRLKKYEVRRFLVACSFHQFSDKNLVAGKALASRRSCFCMNIGNWGIRDDFLSHYVELFGCNFSVAICVESTRVVNTPYVLEFFLLPGDYSNEYIGGLLDSLLATVKEHLPPNFKISSDDVPGEPFFLEIKKNLENGKNCRTQQSSNQMEGSKFHVTLDQLKLQFGNTLDEAAANLGVSRSTLKRIRKIHGIHRWPSHKKNKVNPSLYMKQNPKDAPPIVSSEADSTRSVLPMQPCNRSTRQLQTDQHQAILYQDNEVDKIVTIKASYGHRKIIKFKLNTKSTLQDLQEQVSKRLKWEAGMFEIEYQDEAKDWVTIIIDEDLKDCLQASIDRGESTVSMSINLRLD